MEHDLEHTLKTIDQLLKFRDHKSRGSRGKAISVDLVDAVVGAGGRGCCRLLGGRLHPHVEDCGLLLVGVGGGSGADLMIYHGLDDSDC